MVKPLSGADIQLIGEGRWGNHGLTSYKAYSTSLRFELIASAFGMFLNWLCNLHASCSYWRKKEGTSRECLVQQRSVPWRCLSLLESVV